jgi:gamma-glutamyl:cysteine ligase YbdK (ATP-grasp superfamily)
LGIEIDRSEFDGRDHARFAERLETQLAALKDCLATPGFAEGPRTIGSELELYIVDGDGRARHENLALRDAADDPQLTLELNRYNLEYNLSPRVLADGGLRATEDEIVRKLGALDGLAKDRGAAIVPIGILPTLTSQDFGRDCITDRQRYHALVSQLLKWRGSDFRIDINGAEPLQLAMSDITLEGANTSFQVHLREDPARYVDTFNALQLVTPLALAISANSPGLFGHQLWEETRIPLFKQSIDTRHPDRYRWSQPARVSFGHGWARRSAWELFAQTVRLYPPLLPACADGDQALQGSPPKLAELRLHQSTVWQWNRPIYDDAGGGHLRVEMRALPAGPSAVDMVAGAALLVGLAEGLRPALDSLLPGLPFAMAEYNFYRAAQHGLDARLVWPASDQRGLSDRPLPDILAELLPIADAGLATLGVSRGERDRYLNTIDQRLAARTNGARWQRACLQQLLGRGVSKSAALGGMLQRYREQSLANRPLVEWDR